MPSKYGFETETERNSAKESAKTRGKEIALGMNSTILVLGNDMVDTATG